MTPIKAIDSCLQQLNQVILGKDNAIKLSLTCLLARGHLLIEDIPGMGKTTLSHALASSLGLSYRRIQFTSDLLPADLLGVNIFEREKNAFSFHPGPVFSNVVLADEINRAPPKTQSALLEAMEEQQVTIEGETHKLPEPFFVIATQNPTEQSGTYPLPESQLDRFTMRISLGYPDAKAEKELLMGQSRRAMLHNLPVQIPTNTLPEFQKLVGKVKVSESLVDYVYRLVDYSRHQDEYRQGLSPRAAMSLLHAAKSWALVSGRDHLLPDDIQAVFPSVAEHRISEHSSQAGNLISQKILQSVDIF